MTVEILSPRIDTNSFSNHRIDINHNGKAQQRVSCPQCQKSAKDKTLSANIDSGVFNCFRCGFNGHIKAKSVYTTPVKPTVTDQSYRAKTVKNICIGLQPITPDTATFKYLQHRLGSKFSKLPDNLKHHPSLPYFDDEGQFVDKFPAMVAIIQNQHGAPVGLHRAYLTSEGQKAKLDNVKKLTSAIREGAYRGAAIRLYKPSSQLAIAEGIETALAIHLATDLPVWSTVCANWMKNVVIPADIETVYIFGDNDVSNTGQDAANCLAESLYNEGRKVKVILPEFPGDWLDVYGVNK